MNGKTIIQGAQTSSQGYPVDFNKDEFDAALKTKGYSVIHEKAYLCPCKSKESDNLNICKNCGGSGWLFANPTKTNMIITGIMSDNAFKQGGLEGWGMLDTGSVKITSYNEQKLSQMDKISILDATGEHNEILYPSFTDDGIQLFAFTKYKIKSFDYIALFQDATQKLKKLVETVDYLIRDNTIILNTNYNSILNPCLTVRYTYHPVIYVSDILRESMTSPALQGAEKLILPVLAIGKRAHLIKDVENFQNTRLLDNSWKPNACDTAELTNFERQLRYTSALDIFNNLTEQQKVDLLVFLSSSVGNGFDGAFDFIFN